MLNAFKISDTIERLHFRDIRDNCIVTDTHLVGMIIVGGSNLFEKSEAQAMSYMMGFGSLLNQIGIPVQLITQSRPKKFDDHIDKIRKLLKKNDFSLELAKDPEWFEIYYANDIKNKRVTIEEARKEFENSDPIMKRSMLESYIERLSTAIRDNNILEKRYYFIVSTLDQPEGVSEKDEQNYNRINFEDEHTFKKHHTKLLERLEKITDLIKTESAMEANPLQTEQLVNIMFDCFNFPASYKHSINTDITEYGKVPPILENGVIYNNEKQLEKIPFYLSWTEKLINASTDFLNIKYGTKNTERDKISNPMVQLIKPYAIDDSGIDYAKVNDQFLYTIHIDGFGGDFLEDLSLWPILTMEHSYDLSIHIIPLDKEKSLIEINKKRSFIDKDTQERVQKKSVAERTVIETKAGKEYKKYSALESDLSDKNTNIWSISIDVTFRASSLDDLLRIKKMVSKKLSSRHIRFSEAEGNHYFGFISTLPLLTNLLSGFNRPFERMTRFTQEMCHFYPYCPSSIQMKKGVMLGLAMQGDGEDKNMNIEFLDIFDRSRVINSNLAIIGNGGSGKTTFMHGFLKNQKLLGYRSLILDYLGNYIRWAEDMKDSFQVIRIDPTSNDKINPCDIIIPGEERIRKNESFIGLSDEAIKEKLINDKVSELSAYFRIFLEDYYDPIIRGILDEATKNIYSRRLESIQIGSQQYINDIMLSDIVNELSSFKDKDKKQRCKDIADMIRPYATGSFSGMFNSKTNVTLDDRDVVFYFRGNKDGKYEEIATLQAFILIKQIVYSSRGNLLVIDELHKIFRMESKEISNFFRAQIAMIRNMDGGIIGMTQLLKQVVNTQAGEEFLEIAVTKLYLAGGQTQSQDDTDIALYDKTLSNSSKRFLQVNNRPGYGILKVGTEQIQLKIENHADLSIYKRYKPPLDA